MDKPFKTHEELIALLASRGIDFSKPESRSFAKKKLQRIGYYNLINGYSNLFFTNEEKDIYRPDTTIEEIYNLYIFDQKLREILLHYILPVETNVKSLIAYYFPKHHPETHYLIYTNFDTSKKWANQNITELISEIQRQISSRCADPSIEHYLKNYGYIPIWVLNNILTFGTISKFYSLMRQKERQEIAKTFHISDNELESALFYLSSVRNFCAHGNRIYCYRSKRPFIDTKFHICLNIPKTDKNEFSYGKRDLFATMLIFKILLSKQEFRKIVKEFDIALKNLDARSKVLPLPSVLNCMGFPTDWKTMLLQK